MTADTKSDKASYDTAKEHLQVALEQMIAAGRSVREFVEFALEKFGDAVLPHLKRFLDEVWKGKIQIKGLTESARAAILGVPASPEQRERMIREAAYFRAEKRGFVGGSAEDNWRAAEDEVDERLAQEAGLVESGRKAVVSLASAVERDLGSLKRMAAGWVEARLGEGTSQGQRNELPTKR
jgi:Protein of unknown function (DUF2934)